VRRTGYEWNDLSPPNCSLRSKARQKDGRTVMILNSDASNKFYFTSLNKFYRCHGPLNDQLDKRLSVEVAMAMRPIMVCPRNHALHIVKKGSVPSILTELGLQ
jgi:hypothetical protein